MKNCKVKINSLNIVATWNYDTLNDDCPLCRKHLMAPTQLDIDNKCIKNNIVIGKCQHAYHKSCIDTWLKNKNLSCIVCKLLWSVDKNVSSGNYCEIKKINIPAKS